MSPSIWAQQPEPSPGAPTVEASVSSAWDLPVTAGSATDLDQIPTPQRESGAEWVFVPIPFKSPLLGYGVKFGALHLYSDPDDPHPAHQPMYGAGGMYAEGGTWGLAAFDRRYWSEGQWRTTAAALTGDFSYKLTLNEAAGGAIAAARQSASGAIVQLDRAFLISGWLGGGLQYAQTAVTLSNLPVYAPGLAPEVTYNLAVVNFRAEWDTRSDLFYPTYGMLAKITVDISHGRSDLADSTFTRYAITYNGYHAINDKSVIAWRAYLQTVAGQAPYFAYPWFGSGSDLRGYSPGQYVGKSLVAIQGEWRWQITEKFGVVSFGGVGGVYGVVPSFQQSNFLPAGGVGIRWRVSKKDRINFRIDYGVGRDDSALIISIGEAF